MRNYYADTAILSSMAFDLTTSPMPELLLLLGGLIALVIAIVGRSKKTIIDNVAVALGFIVGAVMIVEAVMIALNGTWPGSTMWITGILGFGLFMRVFRKVKVALIVSLVAALITGVGLYLIEKSAHTGFLTPIVIVIIALVVMALVYGFLGVAEFFADLAGAIVSWRPVLFILGILALVEAVLLFTNSSLSAIIG